MAWRCGRDMDDYTSWICGLMRHNTNELGFIPSTTVSSRYIRNGDFIIQSDERGRRIGYILHGPIAFGRVCVISQHCVEIDKRNSGYGQQAVRTLVDRCISAGASSIRLRCAADLPAVHFWQSCGFVITNIVPGGQSRNRMIAEMVLHLDLPLFSNET